VADVFLSYRREGGSAHGRALYQALARRLGASAVFLDVDSLEGGSDWLKTTARGVGEAIVVLVIIDRSWAKAHTTDGAGRLSDPKDPVRTEILLAGALSKVIVPVLVDGAKMPTPRDLPADLHPLCRLHAHEVTHSHFDQDVEHLLRIVRSAVRDPVGFVRASTDGLRDVPWEERAFARLIANPWWFGSIGFVLFWLVPWYVLSSDYFRAFLGLTEWISIVSVIWAFHPFLLLLRRVAPGSLSFWMLGRQPWWIPAACVYSWHCVNAAVVSVLGAAEFSIPTTFLKIMLGGNIVQVIRLVNVALVAGISRWWPARQRRRDSLELAAAAEELLATGNAAERWKARLQLE